MKQEELEQKALELIKSWKTQEEIEKELEHEFIFFKEMKHGEYVRVTLWK